MGKNKAEKGAPGVWVSCLLVETNENESRGRGCLGVLGFVRGLMQMEVKGMMGVAPGSPDSWRL